MVETHFPLNLAQMLGYISGSKGKNENHASKLILEGTPSKARCCSQLGQFKGSQVSPCVGETVHSGEARGEGV